ncbi:chemotaxis protein CheB [Gordonia lacunae]|uniref:protein-glutamate methylesterase n=1 Tax=Gordonia lacunae TaxID=417102 RepID=A0A243QEE8_9ACTN|nr:chemotaxis protein CheB [Gordonia lacunae]OUC80003.1 chemotaxis protein CheB [Gordonia lacunae]
MTQQRVVAIGASAGGVEALSVLVSSLPADFSQAVLVVLHMPVGVSSALPRILDRAGPLPAVAAENDMELRPGTIYVGVPDRHLLLNDDRLAVTDGPTENRHRPSINALFRSLALHAGPYGTGVLLSGALDDGVNGLVAIRERGGVTVVQDPADAAFPAMPTNAISRAEPDHIVTAADAAKVLTELSGRQLTEITMEPDRMLETENRIAMGHAFAKPSDSEDLGPPTNFVCPDCHGGLMQIDEHSFRCRIGHAWSADALLQAQSAEIDSALGMAIRSLQEKAELAESLAAKVSPGVLQKRYQRTSAEARHAADVLRTRLWSPPFTEGDAAEAVQP